MANILPDKQRRFAVRVAAELQKAGYVAYWAGGCVRDRLLGQAPIDYDVATSARPGEIRRIFSHKRTLSIGAAFGVITILGPPGAGQIEAATFRCDDSYSDGRRPDSVTFSNAEEDARRRDFTINGMFYDPLSDEVIDYVGGREDIERRLIRAIGRPQERFAEDKLRMIRAVRFSASLSFAIEAETLAAVAEMAPQVTVVSVERIAGEMRRMLTSPGRERAVRLLIETGLAAAILPEIIAPHAPDRIARTLAVLTNLQAPSFPLALAALLQEFADSKKARAVCRRWKLSNDDTDRTAWLVANYGVLPRAAAMPWSALQPLMIHAGIFELLSWEETAASLAGRSLDFVAFCREKLDQPRELLDPLPLLTGDDLVVMGLKTGPVYKRLLDRIRAAQLDGELTTKQAAVAAARRLFETENP